MKNLNFTVKNLENKNILVSFPSLENANVELRAGKHINSKNNWSRFTPHGNSKQVSNFEFTERNFLYNEIKISFCEMTKLDENKYPNQNKYRVVVHGNFGSNGYCTTGEMKLSKEQFNNLTSELKGKLGKNSISYE